MLKYILEIKNRLFLICIAWFSTIFISYFYKEILLFITVQINEHYYPTSFYFIFTNLIEIFNTYIKLIVFLTNQIFSLYFLYHLFLFISPALFKLEYKYFYYLIKRIILVWFFSIIFFTYVFLPLTWSFFLSFQNFIVINLYFEAKLNEFLLFYISLYYLCIFYCMVFMFLFFILNYININSKFIKKLRKIYYYLFIFFSTLISPPDIFNQVFISLFIIVAYEFLIITLILKFRLVR